MRESKWQKRVEHAGDKARHRASGNQPSEQIRCESRERKAGEYRDVVRCDRRSPDGAERKEKNRDPIEMLTVGERIARGIKEISIEKMQRLMECGVPIPIEHPRGDEWITR